MRRPIRFAVLGLAASLLCLAASGLWLAQNASADGTSGTKLRPLTLGEGRAIVRESSWVEREDRRTTDCSHLVHDLYEQSGYLYPYASSLELYNGTKNFARVKAPQPGDLIVWRGHVGIVVDPQEHSFFSSVSEGARAEYYDSAYWRARGHARFYRYLTNSPAKSRGRITQAANQREQQELKARADSRGADSRPTLQAVKTVPAAAGGASGEATPASAIRAANSMPMPVQISGRQPKAADVAAALAQANENASDILRTGNLQQHERPVVVYRDLQVSGMEVEGKRATARVQIETLAALSGERMESQQSGEEHQVELQRTKKGWVMTTALANETVYVPRDAALRILAARLALLTQDAETSPEKDREQTQIIRFLNLLVD